MSNGSNSIKVVADTNLLVAGGLKPGYARDFLLQRNKTIPRYSLFTSEIILLELQQKLEELGLTRIEVVDYVNNLGSVARIVRPTQKVSVVRDSDDDKIIECALEAKAHLIVSFDKDLLDMKEYESIKIAHPRMLKYWFKPKGSS
jgi:putative PIN family toxin of toxin-antitoxin system